MKRVEIKILMEQGTLYSFNWGLECKVIHLFKHKAWILHRGKIKSIMNKFINKSKFIPGESTYRTTPRLTTGKEYEILENLRKSYLSNFGVVNSVNNKVSKEQAQDLLINTLKVLYGDILVL